MRLTWKEIKKRIESEGVSDDTVVECMDFDYLHDEIKVQRITPSIVRVFGLVTPET